MIGPTFYVLMDEGNRGALWVIQEGNFDEFALLKGELMPQVPVRYKRHIGKIPYDAIPSSYAGVYLLTERVLAIFRERRFTGWTVFPVEVYGKGRIRLDGYWGLGSTGRCGPIDKSLSQRVHRPPPVPNGRGREALLGLYFDPATWDGSDFFVPKGAVCVLITQAVRDALVAAKITNLQCKSVHDIEFPILGQRR